MPTDIAEMAEMQDTAQKTGTSTPEHHQTQAAASSPQAGSSAASSIANMTGGSAGASGTGLGGASGSNLGAGTGSSAGTTSASPTSPASMASGSSSSAGSPTGTSRRGGSHMSPFSLLGNPFGMMRSMMDQMDRLFEDFTGTGLSRSRSSMPSPLQGGGYGTTSLWYPQIEVSERGDNLVVCADLPGMKKEDVHLEVHEDHLVLQGERQHESDQNQGGLYRTERSYGSFYRTIPLPDGVNPDQVKATFRDGVLEVTVPVPNRQQQLQGRRIEIT